MKNLFRPIVLAALALFPSIGLTATADHDYRGGSAVVYKHPYFRGPALEINGPVRNLAYESFNDTISSIELRGAWEICVDPDFRGKCTIIDGSVARLSDLRMNDNITSLRPVSGRRAGRGYRDRDYGRDDGYGRDRRRRGEAITLFRDPGFRGAAFGENGAVPDLKRLGFNDTASSIDVSYGSWLVCEDPYYRGRCVVIDAPVASLSTIGLNDRVTSIRPYDGRRDRRRY